MIFYLEVCYLLSQIFLDFPAIFLPIILVYFHCYLEHNYWIFFFFFFFFWSFLMQVTCKLEKNLYSTEGGYSVCTCWLEKEEWLWYVDQLYPFWFSYFLLISVWEISIDIVKLTLSLVKVCNILVSYLNLNFIYTKIKSILYVYDFCLSFQTLCVCVCLPFRTLCNSFVNTVLVLNY